MRVVPAPGLVLRDPRTHRLVDPELGVEVDAADPLWGWLLGHGDCVELDQATYEAAQAKRDLADQAEVAEHLAAAKPTPPAPPAVETAKPAAKSPPSPPAPPPAEAAKPEGAV